jgi:hypothetical protein
MNEQLWQQRQQDLRANIAETLDLIKQYEVQRRLSNNPSEQRRAMRRLADLQRERAEYQAELERQHQADFNTSDRDLAKSFTRYLALLKEYEDALRYEDDPGRRMVYQRMIERLRTWRASNQQEYESLRVVGDSSAAMQSMDAQMQEINAKLNALLSAQSVASSHAAPAQAKPTPSPELPPLRARVRVSVGGKSYFIQQLLVERTYDTVVVRLARARDESVNRDIIIKQLEQQRDRAAARPALDKARADARIWADAARTCAHLSNVLEIHEMAGTLWVIAEWIAGRPLSQIYATNGPLPNSAFVDQIVRDTLDVCEALAALHTKRLLHLNISPDNIFQAGRRGSVLVDLALTGDPQRGESGMPGFQAPEQTRARPAGTFLKAATDIYGLGATLYFLLTHRMPATTHSSPQTPPSALNPAVPASLDAVLLNTLALDPDKRFARADDLKYALRSALRKQR